MILDSGIFFSKKTSICLLGNLMIVGHRSTFKSVRVQVVGEGRHSSLHLKSEGKRKRSYLERIADNPLLILKEKGEAKINLALYVSFITRGKYKPSANGTKRQRIIRNIIDGEKDIWAKIITTDICAYEKLSNALGVDVDVDSRDTLVKKELTRVFGMLHGKTKQNMDEREATHEIIRDGGLLSETGFVLRVHHDFCTVINRKSIVDELDKEYGRMVDSIVCDKLNDETQECLVSHPFYNEIELFNSFVVCRGDLSLFDRSRLDRNIFHTITERGIRDFISNRVQEFYLKRR